MNKTWISLVKIYIFFKSFSYIFGLKMDETEEWRKLRHEGIHSQGDLIRKIKTGRTYDQNGRK